MDAGRSCSAMDDLIRFCARHNVHNAVQQRTRVPSFTAPNSPSLDGNSKSSPDRARSFDDFDLSLLGGANDVDLEYFASLDPLRDLNLDLKLELEELSQGEVGPLFPEISNNTTPTMFGRDLPSPFPGRPSPSRMNASTNANAVHESTYLRLQRERNEEIAHLLSPFRRVQEREKVSGTHSSSVRHKKSNNCIRRKFSLLSAPSKSKNSTPKPFKMNNSMRKWHEDVMPKIRDRLAGNHIFFTNAHAL